MKIAVLGSSGTVGRELVRQALDRGHRVTAISRHPGRPDLPPSADWAPTPVDVLDPAAVGAALAGQDLVLSALGPTGNTPGEVRTAGVRAIVAAGVPRAVSLGALGTGASAGPAGFLTRSLIRAFMRSDLDDRLGADSAMLAAGGVVLHVGPMGDGPVSDTRRVVPPDRMPRRWFPASISRATVAATMLDVGEAGPFGFGQVLVPLER